MINSLLKRAVDSACEGLKGDNKERLQKYFASTENIATLMRTMRKDEIFLTHGDYRPSNLMHRHRNGNLEVVPIDYQTVKAGNPVGDLMHFVFSGSDEEFRRLHYQQLMDHYFKQLTLALKQLNVDVKNVYPRETFDADLIRVRLMGVIPRILTHVDKG
ncbi:uncharacterized protein LOC134655464 [Cydia amplana]|uniref:uncharacterized protein LOC134655464 n=1 Tax=Cydia amplana TaxID=1869771 RepID=UPI002FE690EB